MCVLCSGCGLDSLSVLCSLIAVCRRVTRYSLTSVDVPCGIDRLGWSTCALDMKSKWIVLVSKETLKFLPKVGRTLWRWCRQYRNILTMFRSTLRDCYWDSWKILTSGTFWYSLQRTSIAEELEDGENSTRSTVTHIRRKDSVGYGVLFIYLTWNWEW